MTEWDDLNQHIAQGSQRLADFVLAAAESGRAPQDDWRSAIHDAVLDLDRIVSSPLAHPDSVAAARQAIGALAHIWLTVEEAETLYLGDRVIPPSTV